ncbi:MAG: MFS transporter [Acidimicrobiia bacterium]|nr:MFS transporter [Acidimicrobiia bacterium]
MLRPPPTRPRAFTGWRILALAVVTGAMTGPGQTIGVSVFIDPIIEHLDLSRSQVSTAYLIGTMTAALGLPAVGQRIDRHGVRTAMTAIGFAFAVGLVWMAGVQGFVTLTIGFVAIRLFGQGSLSLVSTVAVTHWFDRWRGTALGVFATGTGILMALVPVGLSVVIEGFDWRIAWLAAAAAVLLVVIPIARHGMVDRPADVGEHPDGIDPDDVTQRGGRPTTGPSATRREAIRTGRFWVLIAASMSVGMLSTALNFHQISLLGDAGLTPTEAAVMFLPQVIGAAAAGLLFGYLADRLTGRTLIPMAMSLLAASLLLATSLTPGLVIVLYAITLGAAGGAARSVTSTLLPRWFGTGHIGSVQGTATFLNVASTSLGPVAFAVARDLAGDYEGAALWFALLPVAAGLAAAVLPKVTAESVVGVEDVPADADRGDEGPGDAETRGDDHGDRPSVGEAADILEGCPRQAGDRWDGGDRDEL